MAKFGGKIQTTMSATKVQYRQLGKSGLRVSVPIVSANNAFSVFFWNIDHLAGSSDEFRFTQMGSECPLLHLANDSMLIWPEIALGS